MYTCVLHSLRYQIVTYYHPYPPHILLELCQIMGTKDDGMVWCLQLALMPIILRTMDVCHGWWMVDNLPYLVGESQVRFNDIVSLFALLLSPDWRSPHMTMAQREQSKPAAIWPMLCQLDCVMIALSVVAVAICHFWACTMYQQWQFNTQALYSTNL